MKKRITFSLLAIVFMSFLFTDANSFAESFRCPNRNYSQEKCEKKREDALRFGCATAAEIAAQKKDGYYPECMGADLFGWCKCGCFVPGTKISTIDPNSGLEDSVSIEDMSKNMESKIVTLSAGSSVDFWDLTSLNVRETTKGHEKNDIVVIEVGENILKLTKGHAVLLSDGRVIKAADLKSSDLLVDKLGNFVPINRLSLEPYDGLVYNVESEGNSPEEHIIIAEGIAVGDLIWQNQLAEEMSRIRLRK